MNKQMICDKCGRITTSIDAGFDPVVLNMDCDCGGKWRYKVKDHSDDDRLPWTDKGHIFRLHSTNGSDIVEFRFHDGKVQRRSLINDGEPYSGDGSSWKDEPKHHINESIKMKTPHGEWINYRMCKTWEKSY